MKKLLIITGMLALNACSNAQGMFSRTNPTTIVIDGWKKREAKIPDANRDLVQLIQQKNIIRSDQHGANVKILGYGNTVIREISDPTIVDLGTLILLSREYGIHLGREAGLQEGIKQGKAENSAKLKELEEKLKGTQQQTQNNANDLEQLKTAPARSYFWHLSLAAVTGFGVGAYFSHKIKLFFRF